MLDKLRDKIRGYIPFTNWWFVEQKLDKTSQNILDLGCGNGGKPMQFLNRHRQFYTVGVDGYGPYIEQCRRDHSHDELVLGDIRHLPYSNGSFDVVLCMGVLEHLEKVDGNALIKSMGMIARKQIIVLTDIGEYVHGALDGNVLQIHRYIWNLRELREQGFELYGLGIPHWYGETGLEHYIPQTLRGIVELPLRILTGWFVYSRPQYGGKVLCIKEVR